MDDEEVLAWIRDQAAGARSLFSVCTGALICGAAGLLKGRRATTHWASMHLLPVFGATAVNERVVADGNMVFAAGVTAGIDGALRVAADLRGAEVAQEIQLVIAYDRTAVWQRHARHGATGHPGASADILSGGDGAAGANRSSHRRATRASPACSDFAGLARP